VATLIRDNVPAGKQIYTSFPDGRPSLDFYSDCKIIPTSITDLQNKFSHQSYLLVDNETLQKMTLKQSKIIGEAKGFNLITTN
jgi:hypothetical protein